MDILNVTQNIVIDNSITHSEFHAYEPYLPSKLGNNDEIIIPIHEIEKYTLPSESFLYIEGKLTKDDGNISNTLKLINNGIAFLFKEIRYQLNGVTIDSVRDVGLTSTIKGYLSYNKNECNKLKNAGWYPGEASQVVDAITGLFTVCIPLKFLMGFFEDYKKVVLNSKQELILVRDNSDKNATINTVDETPKIELTKLTWNVPHISVAIPQELALTKLIERNTNILIAFRSWELIEYPELTRTSRHNWPVKTSTKVNTPRHVAVCFQNNLRDKATTDMSKFVDIKLRNIKVYLNSERYPYNDLFLDFDKNKYSLLYDMFSQFQRSYYGTTSEPIFSPREFQLNAPITYIDCSHQKDTIETGPVVMRVEFELHKDLADDVSAYCLVLHDKIFSYNPLTKIVRQM